MPKGGLGGCQPRDSFMNIKFRLLFLKKYSFLLFGDVSNNAFNDLINWMMVNSLWRFLCSFLICWRFFGGFRDDAQKLLIGQSVEFLVVVHT